MAAALGPISTPAKATLAVALNPFDGEEGDSLTYCKMFIGDKLDNVIVVKLRQNGKVVAEYKADAKKCSSKLK